MCSSDSESWSQSWSRDEKLNLDGSWTCESAAEGMLVVVDCNELVAAAACCIGQGMVEPC